MKIFRLFVLVPLAILAAALLLVVGAWAASLFPAWLSVAACAVLGVCAVWFFLTRRGSSPTSEYAFLRQSSKEGLL